MSDVKAEAKGADRPRARDDAVFRSLGPEWVIYDPRTRLLHVLNTTAALVWSFCDGSRSPEEIARELTDVLSDLPSESLVVDEVRGVLDAFRNEGLLE